MKQPHLIEQPEFDLRPPREDWSRTGRMSTSGSRLKNWDFRLRDRAFRLKKHFEFTSPTSAEAFCNAVDLRAEEASIFVLAHQKDRSVCILMRVEPEDSTQHAARIFAAECERIYRAKRRAKQEHRLAAAQHRSCDPLFNYNI